MSHKKKASETEDRILISAEEIKEKIQTINFFGDSEILSNPQVATLRKALNPRTGAQGESWLLELMEIFAIFPVDSGLKRRPGATEMKKARDRLVNIAKKFQDVFAECFIAGTLPHNGVKGLSFMKTGSDIFLREASIQATPAPSELAYTCFISRLKRLHQNYSNDDNPTAFVMRCVSIIQKRFPGIIPQETARRRGESDKQYKTRRRENRRKKIERTP